jgi:hypothetical protein
VATHIRTERIGLRSYLASRKVPGYESPECLCGFAKQTVKHILVHCPMFSELRQRMLDAVGTPDYCRLVTMGPAVRDKERGNGRQWGPRRMLYSSHLGRWSLHIVMSTVQLMPTILAVYAAKIGGSLL